MSLTNVIEVSAESTYGYDDAARQAVRREARAIQNFSAAWLQEIEPVVRNDAVTPFRVKAQIAFVLQEEDANPEAAQREYCASAIQADRKRGS
jgi:flavin-binding protein dodecin